MNDMAVWYVSIAYVSACGALFVYAMWVLVDCWLMGRRR